MKTATDLLSGLVIIERSGILINLMALNHRVDPGLNATPKRPEPAGECRCSGANLL